MTEIERLEKEMDLAAKKLTAEQLAYRTAKMRLRQAKIEAGVTKPEDAVVKFVAEVREKIELFRSKAVREILEGLCDALEGKGGVNLLDLDDKYRKFEQNK